MERGFSLSLSLSLHFSRSVREKPNFREPQSLLLFSPSPRFATNVGFPHFFVFHRYFEFCCFLHVSSAFLVHFGVPIPVMSLSWCFSVFPVGVSIRVFLSFFHMWFGHALFGRWARVALGALNWAVHNSFSRSPLSKCVRLVVFPQFFNRCPRLDCFKVWRCSDLRPHCCNDIVYLAEGCWCQHQICFMLAFLGWLSAHVSMCSGCGGGGGEVVVVVWRCGEEVKRRCGGVECGGGQRPSLVLTDFGRKFPIWL